LAPLGFNLASLSLRAAAADLDVAVRQALAEVLLGACLVLCHDLGDLGDTLPVVYVSSKPLSS